MKTSNQHKPYPKKSIVSRLYTGLVGLALTGMFLYSCNSGNSKIGADDSKTPKTHISKMVPKDIVRHLNPNSKQKPLVQQMALTELLTYPLYDEQFNTIRHSDELVAKELYRYDLEDLVNMKALSSKNIFQKDLWIPLGLKDAGTINFGKGMKDSWDDKLMRFQKTLTYKQKSLLIEEELESVLKTTHNVLTKSNLREYREVEISKGIDMLKLLSDNYLAENYTGDSPRALEMQRLMSTVKDNLSANVLLGYNIQEMLPPTFEKMNVNAAAKAYFLNQFLLKGGKEVIERFPAKYDIMLSYGPFQLTKWAVAEIDQRALDLYLPRHYASPKDMAEISNLQDHVNLAVKFAYANWLELGETLADNSKLKKFNDGFEYMDAREKKILLAGITACMHHKPKETIRDLINYLNSNDDSMKDMQYNLYESLSPQLTKYYRSSAEAYLLMKVYDVLDSTYSKKYPKADSSSSSHLPNYSQKTTK